MKRRLAIALGALLILGALLFWWSRDGERAIATVSARAGDVSRDSVNELGRWSETHTGDILFAGDGVRTGEGSEAELEVGRGTRIQTRPSTIFRLYLGEMPEADMRIDLDFGAASLITSAEGAAFETELGLARMSPSSRLRVERAGADGDFVATLESGEVQLLRLDGIEIDLTVGESMSGGPLDAGEPSLVVDTVAALDAGAPVESDGPGEESVVETGDEPARFERGGGSVILEVGSARLLPSPGFVAIEIGHAIIETGDEDLPIRVPGAQLIARAGGTRATADVSQNSVDLAVFEGGVEVHSDQGEDELIGPGESIHIEEGELTVAGRGPTSLDLVIPSTGSVKILDPAPPTNVGFSLPSECEGTGLVERIRRGEREDWDGGIDRVALRLGAGAHALQFRCIVDGRPGPVVARARVAVRQNAGQAPLPPAPPVTQVDLDGRTYRVHYQSRLPRIHVRWPRAPGAGPYTLERTRGGRTLTSQSATADFQLRGRQLGEGDYRLVAKNAGGRPSRTTNLHIEFDNAATGASLSEPASRSFGREEPVNVSGTAVQGARVRIEGGSAEVDGSGRFTGRAWVPAGRRAFAVRVSLPGHAPQYFIRRVREASR